MYQQHETTSGEAAVANCHEQPAILECEVLERPEVKQLGLEWIGPLAFQCRYGVPPGVEGDSGMWFALRRDQRICHHRATAACPTDLVYVYDLTWDEYAVLATDIPWVAVEAVINLAVATDTDLSAEVFAGLLTDHLAAPTPRRATTTALAIGVEP